MAETPAQKIARLRSLLESGVTSDSVDGASTSFDHESIRRELRRLEEANGNRRKRSRIITPMMTRR